jgi:hypothetical protein
MFRDRVEQTTNTAGSGAYTLDGTVIGKRSFAAVFADNEPVIYVVVKDAAWECNLGTLDTGTSPPTLSRDRLIGSSTGSAIVWPDSTSKTIFGDVPAEMFGPLGNQLIAAVVGGTANAITLATKVQTPLYKDGMVIEFEATGTPTGAVTAGANALALKPVLHKSGDQAGATSWEAGAHLRFRFDESLDSWVVMAGHRDGSNVGADIASAATLVRPANARDGSYHRITGAVTVANLWAGAPVGIEHEFLVVTGFTLTNSANLICPSGAGIVAAANDRFRVRHTGSNVWAITSYTRANGKALIETPATVPTRLKRLLATAVITTQSTTTAVIPNDDTLPQSGEGTQIFNVTGVVPSNGSSDIQIECGLTCTHSLAANPVAMAFFQDAAASAFFAAPATAGNANFPAFFYASTIIAAGGVASRDYKVRVGPNTAGTMGINGETGGRQFNTAARAFVSIWEILP